MDVWSIPVGDPHSLYRPLLRRAFIGNQVMARLVEDVIMGNGSQAAELPPAVASYLGDIGFLDPDPPPPSPPGNNYQPTHAVLLLTNRCNLRCIYCYANAGEGPDQEISVELARAAIDIVHRNARERGHTQFTLTFHGGGEPVLAWNTLCQAIQSARSKDLSCYISLVSNGLWTKTQTEWLVQHLDGLTLSIDGAQKTQDRQRPTTSGRGTFRRVFKTLQTLDRQGFAYNIRMTALPPWREQLARDVAFLCEETGCQKIQVEPAFNSHRGGYQPPSLHQAEEFAAGFMEAFEVAARTGRHLYFSGARPWLLTATFCTAPYGALIVTPRGDLVTCYEVTDPGHPLAGLLTIGRLDGRRVVVDETRRAAVLRRLEARRENCRGCFGYWHCAGDCHVKAFYPGSEADPERNTRCQMNRYILAEMLLWSIAASADGVYRGEEVADQE
mgnify:FL=1